MNKNKYMFLFLLLATMTVSFSNYSCKIAVLKYNRGGGGMQTLHR